MACLKAEKDKIDIDRLRTVRIDFSKLSNVVSNDVVKTMYDKLVAKINNIDIRGIVNKYDIGKSDLEMKIIDAEKKNPDTSKLVTKTYYDAKTSEIENKIPKFSSLATNSTLTIVENEIPNVSNLVKKNTKVSEIEKKVTDIDHDKYITNPFKLTAETIAARLSQANLITKADFDNRLIRFNSNKRTCSFWNWIKKGTNIWLKLF